MTFNQVWLEALEETLEEGEILSPRGIPTRDCPSRRIVVGMTQSVLTVPERKLSYQFLAAEAHWILSGDNLAANIVPWNKNLARFSDDGVTFFGAYGPRIRAQLAYVVATLLNDPDSRQAGLTIWRETPPATKDVPCTIAMFFHRRNDRLNAHVFMRSSDLWLGLPYDVFSFSMVAHLVCCRLNEHLVKEIRPGKLFLTAASSHLYESNAADAERCVSSDCGDALTATQPWPTFLYHDEPRLMQTLRDLRDTKPGDRLRWWEARDGA